MNFKQLNEELESLLEISDELKQKVFDKRKEQVDLAKEKLSKTAELIAKTGTKLKQEIKVNFAYGYVDVTEISKDKGEVGSPKNYFENYESKTFTYDISDLDSFVDKLVDDFSNYVNLWFLKPEHLTYDVAQKILICTVLVDKDVEEPSQQDLEAYENNEINLWVADGFVDISIDGEDKPFFITALENAGIDVD